MRSSEAAVPAVPVQRVVLFPPRQKRHGEELAFLPAALEIVETPPSPIGRAIRMAIIGEHHHASQLSVNHPTFAHVRV